MEILRTDPVVIDLYDQRRVLLQCLNNYPIDAAPMGLMAELELVQERIVHRAVGYGHPSA